MYSEGSKYPYLYLLVVFWSRDRERESVCVCACVNKYIYIYVYIGMYPGGMEVVTFLTFMVDTLSPTFHLRRTNRHDLHSNSTARHIMPLPTLLDLHAPELERAAVCCTNYIASTEDWRTGFRACMLLHPK